MQYVKTKLNRNRRWARRSSSIEQLTVLATLAVSSLILLSSCATPLSLSECNTIDWYSKGLSDGENGASMEKFSGYVKDCSRFAVTPDREEYTLGREKGLDSFCTRDRGYEMGLSGHEYMSVCPVSRELEFRSGYDPGKRLHDAERQIKSINSDISKLEGTIADLEREISGLETKIINSSDEQERWTLEKGVRRSRQELIESQLEIVECSNLLVAAIAEYRESVHEANDLGFAAVEKY